MFKVGKGWLRNADRFELVQQHCETEEKPAEVKTAPQEIKVGDVWKGKKIGIKIQVVSKSESGEWGVIIREGCNVGSTENWPESSILNMNLLHRPQPKAKKQPKPQPKKKDGWEIITKPNDYGFYNFGKFIDYTVYKKHNKIKAKTADGIVGYAICSPSDEYDFNIGFKIASTRMKAKWFEREAERLARGDK